MEVTRVHLHLQASVEVYGVRKVQVKAGWPSHLNVRHGGSRVNNVGEGGGAGGIAAT